MKRNTHDVGPFNPILSFCKQDVNLIWLTQQKLVWVFSITLFDALERYIKRYFSIAFFLTLYYYLDSNYWYIQTSNKQFMYVMIFPWSKNKENDAAHCGTGISVFFFSFYDYIVGAYSRMYNGVRVVMKQHFGFNIT